MTPEHHEHLLFGTCDVRRRPLILGEKEAPSGNSAFSRRERRGGILGNGSCEGSKKGR